VGIRTDSNALRLIRRNHSDGKRNTSDVVRFESDTCSNTKVTMLNMLISLTKKVSF
jgi:hypothetical protein